MDDDPNIRVWLTDDDVDHCIGFVLGNVQGTMHVRSALDFSDKLNRAILDWLVRESMRLLAGGLSDDNDGG